MAEPRRAEVVVKALGREILDGVDGPADDARRVDLAVLPCFVDERPFQGLAGLVDWRTSGMLSRLVREGMCTGQAGEALLLPGRQTLPFDRLVVVGLGRAASFDRRAARAAGRRLVRMVERLDPRDVLVALPGRVPERAVVEAVFDGLVGALTLAGPYRSEAQPAARAVGDDGARSVRIEPTGSLELAPVEEAGPRAQAHGEDGLVALETGAERAIAEGPRASLAGARDRVGGRETPRGGAAPAARGWWVVTDPRHTARMRRLLEGPPRAAEP